MSTIQISATTQGRVKQVVTDIIKSLVNWSWTKAILYWIILSAGTMSELAFLIASLWMTLNASIHDFILIFMSDGMTQHISDLAKAAYVGLPECILPLAIATTIGHIRIWNCDRKNWWAVAWSLLYGAPTLTFLGLSLWTIGCSVLKVGYALPDWMIVTRSLGGYTYGITALLYWIIGKPQEADRLKEKDSFIAQLQQEIVEKLATLQQGKDTIIAQLNSEIVALGAAVATGEKTVVDLQVKIAQLEQQFEVQGQELVAARLQIATQKVTRVKSDTSANIQTGDSAQNGKVTNLHGETEKRSKLKKHLFKLVLAGEKVNYKKIAADTGISYNTVRRHASTIIDEIAKDRSTEKLQAVNA